MELGTFLEWDILQWVFKIEAIPTCFCYDMFRGKAISGHWHLISSCPRW